MTRFLVLFAVMISLSACNGTNPFDEIEANTGTATTTPNTTTPDTSGEADNEPEDEGGPISSNTFVLPGTANPSASTAIFRSETRSEGSGNGYAEGFSYDAATDTFTVDNLAFDGDSAYTVVMDGGSRLGIGPFSVFEAPANAVDGLTSSQVEQLTYRALYAVSPDGNSSIAISAKASCASIASAATSSTAVSSCTSVATASTAVSSSCANAVIVPKAITATIINFFIIFNFIFIIKF